jgi:UDP-glucose 4-epimerase
MSDALAPVATMAPISTDMLARVREIEAVWLKMPQETITTQHVFHAGLYARTVRIKGDQFISSVMIKRPTVVIIHGSVLALVNEGWIRLDGYNVVPAAAGRKTIFAALSDTEFTMVFPSSATTIGEAEREFTDETDLLMSHQPVNPNLVTATGE